MASDSRISWGSKFRRWDAGRKLFACANSADSFGYAGDVLFPSMALSQIIEAADAGLLFLPTAEPTERHDAFLRRLQSSFSRRHQGADFPFEIFHAARVGRGMTCNFMAWKTSFDPKTGWRDEALLIPSGTEVVFKAGTGSASVNKSRLDWQASDVGGTSRALWSAFCDSLERQGDPLSGGAPQLASIYQTGQGRTVGVVHDGQRFLHGLPLDEVAEPGSLEWRDKAFQRIDVRTLQLIKGAQRQPRPGQLTRHS